MSFQVLVGPQARADLLRMYEYLLLQAQYLEDLDVAERAMQALEEAMASLAKTPFLFRKDGQSRTGLRRELIVPFGASGYVLKYEIASPQLVLVLAVRHQHEADYH